MSSKVQEMKKLVSNIEDLAKNINTSLDSNQDILKLSHDLVNQNMVFVFMLGEFHATKSRRVKSVNASTVSATKQSTHTSSGYHNVRDSRGRFTRAV